MTTPKVLILLNSRTNSFNLSNLVVLDAIHYVFFAGSIRAREVALRIGSPLVIAEECLAQLEKQGVLRSFYPQKEHERYYSINHKSFGVIMDAIQLRNDINEVVRRCQK